MSKTEKITKATNRVKKSQKKKGFWSKVWKVICWPFKKIAKICGRIWNWICGINLIGLVNCALLVAIIVLFSMLIMDIVACNKKQVVIVAKPVTPTTEQVTVSEDSAPYEINLKRTVLPIKTDSVTRKKSAEAINVVPVKKAEVQIAKQQTAKQNEKFWGDVIIDSRAAGAILHSGATVNGNLYLQDMRKFVLPCGIRINGNLFLRDVNMLQFCGDFVVTGNIYVSPRSSFGPIPKTARVGGHVIL